MTVPKTSVDEDYGIPLGQDNVRRPGKISDVKAEAKSRTMDAFSQKELGSGILALYSCHHPAANSG
jgi:hypothetical protein